MALSAALRHKLQSALFEWTDADSPYSHNCIEPATSGFYYGKPVPYIYNYDLAQDCGRRVHYSLKSLTNFLTEEEKAELDYLTDDGNFELRIITQNQWDTNRNTAVEDGYPFWHQFLSNKTPYDLNDVGTMLGYRGSALVNFNNSWPTGVISQDANMHYFLNNSLVGQTSHHPRNSHHPYSIYWYGDFAAWGRPAIVNLGDTRVRTAASTDLVNLNNITWNGSGNDPQMSLWFGDGKYCINNNYQGITGGDYNVLHSGYFTTATGNEIRWSNPFYTYEFKVSIGYGDFMNGKTGSFYFPIIRKAFHTLYKRTKTKYNDSIPDCFNYTVALVYYHEMDGKWYVEDVIYDRLRTIDRWDLSQLEYSGGGVEYKHPSIMIYGSGNKIGAAWSKNGNVYSCTFNNVPQDAWMSEHFTWNSGDTSVRLDESNKDNWVPIRMFMMSSVANTAVSGIEVLKLSLGTQCWGDEPTDNEGFDVSGMDITAWYNPSEKLIHVAATPYGHYVPIVNTHPLLIWYK